MHEKFKSLGIFFFVCDLVIIHGLGFRTCASNEECMLIAQCPSFAQLLQTNTPDNLKKVQNSICQYLGRKPMVCCPQEIKVEPKIDESPFLLLTPDTQLPSQCGRPKIEDNRIFGGAPAPMGTYPWMAAIGYAVGGSPTIRFLCSGSLINSRYVLTAAHCVDEAALFDKKLSVINLGDWDLSKEKDCEVSSSGKEKCAPKHIAAGIDKITIHPEYNKRAPNSDDIALIRLNVSINFLTTQALVEPVCLAAPSFSLRSAMDNEIYPIAAGWGLTENGSSSDILLRVVVPFAKDELCKTRYGTQFLNKQLCVGGKGGFDTCSGDSGGPLVIAEELGPPFSQIGIVSYGTFPCGLNTVPGVYTSVRDYRAWIIENLRP